MRALLLLVVVLGAHTAEVEVLGHDQDVGEMQRRALTAAQDLGLPADLQAVVAKVSGFSRKPLLQAGSFIELDEGVKAQEELAELIGAASKNGGDADLSKVIAKIGTLEAALWKEATEAAEVAQTQDSKYRLELQDLNTQIAANEAERKALLLSEKSELGARKIAAMERDKSRKLEVGMERVLQEIRIEKQQAWDAYVSRRDKRRKDVMVLHTAVALVCTFDTFKDDDRCKLNKITATVPLPPTTPVHADTKLSALTQEARVKQRDTAQWHARRAEDLAEIQAGKLPQDYVFAQDTELRAQSLLSLIQTGAFKQDEVAKQLLSSDASAQALAPLQTLLIAIQSGDYEKSSKLLDLVIGFIAKVEEAQKADSDETKAEQGNTDQRLVEQDKAQHAEEVQQATLRGKMREHLLQAERLKQQVYGRFQEIERKEGLVAAAKKMAYNARQLHRAQKQVRDEELTNIERLRSLLLVLSGESDPPTCDTAAMSKCTNAEQGMCIFATGPEKRDTKEYCACEWGFYGDACEHKMCPGKVKNKDGYVSFKAGSEGACGGVDKGTCDPTTGTCTCLDFTSGKACESFSTCPGGPTCSGHGQCDLKYGKCLCSSQHYGESCATRKCLGPEIEGVDNLFEAGNPSACNGHGICQDSGSCECFGEHAGPECSAKACLDDCSGRGECNTQTGICSCEPGYSGETCRYKKCPGDCGGLTNGVCDRDSGICRCHKGYSGPGCLQAHTCEPKETSYLDWAMFKPGWSKCPHGSFVSALKTASCSSIDCVDKARCVKACSGKTVLEVSHCYQANWWDSLNAKGWSMCREPYFLAGLYRNKCNSLYCIEMGLCCSLRGASWTGCGHTENWGHMLGQRESWAEVPFNHMVTGLYRHGQSTELRDLQKAAHCSFRMDQQVELGR